MRRESVKAYNGGVWRNPEAVYVAGVWLMSLSMAKPRGGRHVRPRGVLSLENMKVTRLTSAWRR